MSGTGVSGRAADSGSLTDWISAVCSAIAAFIGLITVITVYIAARQLLTEHQAYEMGLSEDTLGPWRSKVKTKKLLGLQQQIQTPVIDLPTLMDNEWKPNIGFPTQSGFKAGRSPSHVEKAPAKAGWVNFIDILGIMPNDKGLYQMSTQSNLVNGIIPMRWAGKDLVGICTMLGFQACEDNPSFKNPMPLPTQWSGPLGWLQFRASADGCIVEFRMRDLIDNQLSSYLHTYYRDEPYEQEPHCLRARLWRSIDGLCLKDDTALYVAGADRDDPGRKLLEFEEAEGEKGEFRNGLTLEDLKQLIETIIKGQQEVQEPGTPKDGEHDDGVLDKLMEGDLSPEQIAEKLPFKPPGDAEALPAKDTRSGDDTLPGLLQHAKKRTGRKEFLMPCRGVLSTIVEGELASSRGLNIADSVEYIRKYMALEEAVRELRFLTTTAKIKAGPRH
jgi:hypothetical protein